VSQNVNNLKRSTKSIFGLMAVLLIIMLGFEWQQINRHVAFVSAEVEGVTVLKKTTQLVVALGEYRGLCAAKLAGEDIFIKQCQNRQAIVTDLLASISEEEVSPFRADGDLRRLKMFWNLQVAEPNTLDYQTLFGELTRAVDLVMTINDKVYAFSNLKLDDQLVSNNYMRLQAKLIPELQESLGQIRGRGTSMMVTGSSLAKNNGDFALVEDQALIKHQLSELLSIRQELTMMGDTPNELKLSLNRAIEQVQYFLEINVAVLSRQDTLNPEGAELFFAAGTQPILLLQTLSQAVVEELEVLLEKRLGRGYAMLFFISFAIVVISFVMWFLYRRTNMAIDAMEQSEFRYRDANDAKTQFLSNMSHELRTPLNGIYGVLQILDSEKDQPKHLQKLTRIALESTEMLTSLIGNILDLAKIEQREVTLENEPFMISDMLETYLPTFRTLAENNDTQFTFMIDPDCHLYWQGDKLRIMQIINNVVGNAIKFSPKASVRFTASSHDNYLRFEVRDTGIGMDKKTLEGLFERFNQGEKNHATEFQGSGLGMAICKELLDLMGGTIDVQSELGQGSDVIIELPLVPLSLPLKPEVAILQAMADLSEEDLHEAQDWRDSHVLLVDDAMNNLFVIEAMLATMVKQVSIASSGFEALEIINHTHVDLLVSDISMPGMDGMQLLKRVRAYQPHIPAVALSGNVLKDDILAYRKAGFDEVLSKPVQKRDLQAAMEKAFILRQAERNGDIPASDNFTFH
jgi:signal transduction histidine kinase/ActR/RegA family two-component response regulator